MFEICLNNFQYLYIVGLMFVLILDSYESINGPPDYVKVEEEEAQQPLQHSRKILQFKEISYSDDNMSTEDYDDIRKESEDGEDYDDVG